MKFVTPFRLQRPIFRALFLLCCVLPTAVIGAWSLVRLRPGYTHRYAGQLAARLGVRVELAGLTHPRPGMVRLDQIRLVDPESGQWMACAQRVRLQRGNGQILVTLDGAEAQRDQLGRLWELFRDRILRQNEDMPTQSHLWCRQLVVRAPDGSVLLKGVMGDLEHIATGPRAAWRFRLADTAEPIRVSLSREQRSGDLVTRFQLDTQTASLPCSLIRPFSHAFDALGPQAMFQGCVWAEHSPSGWDGQLTGHLGGIDLERLVVPASSHQVTGQATAVVQSMRFQHSQIQSANGTISAGPGTISGSLLNAAVQNLGLASTDPSPSFPNEMLRYRQMNLGFVMEASGLSLFGLCRDPAERDPADGTVMILADTRGTRIQQPEVRSVPVVSLVRTLVPQRQLLVPAARETYTLLRILPLPPAVARSGEPGRQSGVQ